MADLRSPPSNSWSSRLLRACSHGRQGIGNCLGPMTPTIRRRVEARHSRISRPRRTGSGRTAVLARPLPRPQRHRAHVLSPERLAERSPHVTTELATNFLAPPCCIAATVSYWYDRSDIREHLEEPSYGADVRTVSLSAPEACGSSAFRTGGRGWRRLDGRSWRRQPSDCFSYFLGRLFCLRLSPRSRD